MNHIVYSLLNNNCFGCCDYAIIIHITVSHIPLRSIIYGINPFHLQLNDLISIMRLFNMHSNSDLKQGMRETNSHQ